MTRNEKIAIVGGAGFIGSYLTESCIRRGQKVIVFDDFSKGRRDYLPACADLTIVKGDILAYDSLVAALEQMRPDLVYHLAAIHHIPTCEREPVAALRTNIEGTENVLRACVACKIPRLFFASSGAVYENRGGALAEDIPLHPTDIYGISKVTGEHLCRYCAERFPMAVTIARFFNAVGPRETNNHLVPDIVAQLAAGKRHVSLGNVDRRRDYIHAADIADGLVALSEIPQSVPVDVFNLGSGSELSVRELVNLFSAIVGDSIKITSEPDRRRLYDRNSQCAAIGKIEKVTGWRPARTVKQALTEVWEEQTTAKSRGEGGGV